MPIFRTQVRMSYPGDGSPGFNSWHFRTTNDSNNDDRLAAATGALESFYDDVRTVLGSDVTVSTDGVWSGLLAATGQTFDVPGWSVSSGTSARLPDFCSILVRWGTAGAGRSSRGRTFLGPCTPAALDGDGNVSTATRQAVLTAAEQLIEFGDGTIVDGAFGVYSRTDQVIRDYTTAAVWAEFASLTSRRD